MQMYTEKSRRLGQHAKNRQIAYADRKRSLLVSVLKDKSSTII